MSTFTYQKITDTNKKTVIKLTGFFDSSVQEANTARISANTLNGALNANNAPLMWYGGVSKSSYELNIFRMTYFGSIKSRLFWSDNNTIAYFSDYGEYNTNGSWVRLLNTGNGNIGIETLNAVANSSYTIILELHKGNGYDMGQYSDPQAYNFGQFDVTP